MIARALGRGPTEPVSRARLAADFDRIGLARGDLVTLGVSLKRVGWLAPGPAAFIDALLDVLGADGTILISCATRAFPLAALRAGEVSEVFDPRATASLTGTVPEFVRRDRRGQRSRHPCNSVASIGRYSEELVGGHDENAQAYAPYRILADLGGKFLGVGIDDRAVGIRHEAQARAGLVGLAPASRGAQYRDGSGRIRVFEWHDIGGCVRRLPELVGELRAARLVTDGIVGDAPAVLMSARASIDEMARLLVENPARNLCGDRSCEWCAALTAVLGARVNEGFAAGDA